MVKKITIMRDDNCRAFLAHCPFFVLATSDADGRCDASPRGGHPGWVGALASPAKRLPSVSWLACTPCSSDWNVIEAIDWGSSFITP